MSEWRVPLTDIAMPEQDVRPCSSACESGWLTMGPRTQAFERGARRATSARPHAVTVSSGTAALHLACLAAGIGPGDEVIVPAFTFVASAAASRYAGAEPVLCDVRSPLRLQHRSRRRRAAHHAAHAARSWRCTSAATRPACTRCARSATSAGWSLIEDCAQAIGAHDRRRRAAQVGTVGELGAFSFFSKKQLCVGEGGMVTSARRASWPSACACCARTR